MSENARYLIETGFKLVAAAVAIFGVWKYFSDVSLGRELEARSRALAMIERYGGQELREARRELFAFWVSKPDVVAHLGKGAVSERAYGNFIRTAFASDPNAASLQRALYVLAAFFDELDFCIDSAVCDRAMAERYFCPIVGRLAPLYAPALEDLRTRSGYDAYGAGLTSLARRCA